MLPSAYCWKIRKIRKIQKNRMFLPWLSFLSLAASSEKQRYAM